MRFRALILISEKVLKDALGHGRFLDVRIIAGRRRHQLCAFAAEVIETAPHRLALHRVYVEGVAGYLWRVVLKHGSKPDRGTAPLLVVVEVRPFAWTRYCFFISSMSASVVECLPAIL